MEAGGAPSLSESVGYESVHGLSLGHIFQAIADFQVIPRYASLFSLREHEQILPPKVYLSGSIKRLTGGVRIPPPEFSQFDLLYARSGAALWLCCHALPLFTEIENALQRHGDSRNLDPVVLTELTLDYLTTSSGDLSTIEQARHLSQLMMSMGIGLSGDTDWAGKLKGIAIEQASFPHPCSMSPLIRWAIEIESSSEPHSGTEIDSLLDGLLSEGPEIFGFDLNRCAYLLLRLQLCRAAPALAKKSLETAGTIEYFPHCVRRKIPSADLPYTVVASQDTYGWALCYQGQYAQAKYYLDLALRPLLKGSDDWLEVQYHRTNAAFWSDDKTEASNIAREMCEAKPDNMWTKRVQHVVTTAQPSPTSPTSTPTSSWRYDVVISFAGEDRASARTLAQALAQLELSVFFDDFERAALWGQNLYEYLTDIYQNRGRYCIVLISKHYKQKRWTQLEWRAIQARCFRENAPYCLPVRIDDTELPGLLPTTGYLSLANDSISAIAEAVAQKLKINPCG